MKTLAAAAVTLTFAAAATASELSILSHNMHGLHPTGEATRSLESHDGTMTPTTSDLRHFSREELVRGHARRLARLAPAIVELAPDFIALQEVGAGPIDRAKTCNDFHASRPEDPFENTALQLVRGLPSHYRSLLACRGNTGWVSDATTYANRRVVIESNGRRQIVHDFSANPYPHGLLIEGMAFVYRSDRWRSIGHEAARVFAGTGVERAFVQLAAFASIEHESRWIIIANVHAGHKLAHFEQSVAIRLAVEDFKNRFARPFDSLAIAIVGDFNAELHRPGRGASNPEAAAWEIAVPGHFDLGPTASFDEWARTLIDRNFDSDKPWAVVLDPAEAAARARSALARLQRANFKPLLEAHQLNDAFARRKIDHLFVDAALIPRESRPVFNDYDWSGTDSLSDHPGVFSKLTWRH